MLDIDIKIGLASIVYYTWWILLIVVVAIVIKKLICSEDFQMNLQLNVCSLNDNTEQTQVALQPVQFQGGRYLHFNGAPANIQPQVPRPVNLLHQAN